MASGSVAGGACSASSRSPAFAIFIEMEDLESASIPVTGLLDLPSSLLIVVLSTSSLGASDIVNTALACKELSSICEDNAIWLPLIARRGLNIAVSQNERRQIIAPSDMLCSIGLASSLWKALRCRAAWGEVIKHCSLPWPLH
jgi:hypothetical protein